MNWFLVSTSLIVIGLGLYALRLINAVKSLEKERSKRIAEARQAVFILIGSFIDETVDRSECVLRIRVLLDAHFDDWPRARFKHFEQISNVILALPFGKARQKMEISMRRKQDSQRQQLLQIHEDALNTELRNLGEWLQV